MYDSCICDYDPPEFHHVRKVKAARKPHKCDECRREIKPGEPYEAHVGKWEGELSTFTWCANCAELCEWAQISVPCFCWQYGNLLDDIRNMVREASHDVPGMFMEYGRRIVKLKRMGGRP